MVGHQPVAVKSSYSVTNCCMRKSIIVYERLQWCINREVVLNILGIHHNISIRDFDVLPAVTLEAFCLIFCNLVSNYLGIWFAIELTFTRADSKNTTYYRTIYNGEISVFERADESPIWSAPTSLEWAWLSANQGEMIVRLQGRPPSLKPRFSGRAQSTLPWAANGEILVAA
jgi:hypothetical protein